MLYERWLNVAAQHRKEIALSELPSGRVWSFEQLAAEADRSSSPADQTVFPQGTSADFVLAVLGAWRHKRVVCPLESEQAPPQRLKKPPKGIVHLKFTSASGGVPKLVAFLEEQLTADAANIVSTMGLRPDWPNLAAISLAHSYGFSNLVLPLLLHGIPLWISGGPLPELIRRAAKQLEDITLPAVPALWKTWHQAQAIPSNVRLAISAGAPLPLMLEQAVFAERGLKIHNFYGSSECGGIAYDRTLSPRQDPALAGAPLDNVHLSVGPNGCFEVRGTAVGTGYWPKSEAALRGGVFRTSDLGEIRDRLVYLLGRVTDLINVAGRKVAPELIERILTGHPDVRECLVFGVPARDPHRGEKIVACLALSDRRKLDVLKQYLIERLPAWQVPREWHTVDTLQVNGRGKLSRAEWKKHYLDTPVQSEFRAQQGLAPGEG